MRSDQSCYFMDRYPANMDWLILNIFLMMWQGCEGDGNYYLPLLFISISNYWFSLIAKVLLWLLNCVEVRDHFKNLCKLLGFLESSKLFRPWKWPSCDIIWSPLWTSKMDKSNNLHRFTEITPPSGSVFGKQIISKYQLLASHAIAWLDGKVKPKQKFPNICPALTVDWHYIRLKVKTKYFF